MSERYLFSSSRLSRNALIVGGVLAVHVAALWALQNGLLRRAAEVVIPVELIAQFVDPPKLLAPPPSPPPPQPSPPQPRQVVKPSSPAPRAAPRPAPSPQPAAIADSTPAPNAPAGTLEPAPPLPVPAPAPPAPAPAPPAVQLPSTDADYAQDCKPRYPAISQRQGEQGRVVVRVLVGTDGQAKQADIKVSSGFDRLDTAAREAMLRCRFNPGKVNGVAQSMAYDAPVNFKN